MAETTPTRRIGARPAKAAADRAPARPQGPSPAEIADPLIRQEAKKAAVWIGMAVVVGLAIYQAGALLVIFGGMVFAAMIDGGVRLLGRVLPIGRTWRIAIVLLLAAAFFVWLLLFAGSQIASQAAQLPEVIKFQAARALAWLASHGVKVDVDSVQGLIEKAMGGIGQLTSALGGVLGGFTTAFLILVLGIYFVLEPDLYRRGFAWLLPRNERAHFEMVAGIMGKTLRRLLAGRLLGMAIEGVSTWILLAIYGVPMAALLGLLTGLLAFLPNIGAPISGSLMILVGFSGGTSMGVFCIIVYVVVQTVDGNIIVPMVAKKTADLAPALVLGTQLIMGALFGILGLALADPLVAMIKILLEHRSRRNEEAIG
ncbi:MAG: AI-2E family transporter [Sphingomonadales bacterium]|nr:AI-2E family transporter [Sphingomonadales bacterium]